MSATAQPPGTNGRNEPPFTEKTIFDLMCSERRRHAIRLLLSRGQTTMDEMVDFVAKSEFSTSSEESHETEGQTVYESLSHPSNDPARRKRWRKERKSVYASLRQHHLPKLEEEDVIEFDTENGIIESTIYTDFFRWLLVPAQPDELAIDDEATPESDVDDRRTDTDFGRTSHGGTATNDGNWAPTMNNGSGAPTADDGDWTRYYAALCVMSWPIAIVDGLNLVNVELITAGEWIVLFLVNLTILVTVQIYSQYRPEEQQIPLVP